MFKWEFICQPQLKKYWSFKHVNSTKIYQGANSIVLTRLKLTKEEFANYKILFCQCIWFLINLNSIKLWESLNCFYFCCCCQIYKKNNNFLYWINFLKGYHSFEEAIYELGRKRHKLMHTFMEYWDMALL